MITTKSGDDEAPASDYLAMAVLAATMALFEVLVTRLLSVVLWYHFVFLSISLAMLGLGAPGVWFALRPPGRRALAGSLLTAAVLIPASVIGIIKLGAPFRGVSAFWVACLLGPMLSLGCAICILLLRVPADRIGRLYASDLLGATLGTALAVPLLYGLPTPILVGSLGVFPLLAALRLKVLRPTVAGAVIAAIVGLGLWGEPYRLRYNKAYDEAGGVLYEKWTPTARITVLAHEAPFMWGKGTHSGDAGGRSLWLDQDGSAGTPIVAFDRKGPPPDYLFDDVTSVAYQLGTPGDVCVIGAGGGRDILAAVKAGASRVDAVEINPFTVDIVNRVFATWSGAVYSLPQVNAVIADGRSFLASTDRRYDVLQISLIDSFAATAAGAYALAENSLYTKEAFRLYWRHLSERGVLSVSRWMVGPNRMEMVRLALLAAASLRDEGVANPQDHLVVLRGSSVGTVLVFRKRVDAALLANLMRVIRDKGFALNWPESPGAFESSLVGLGLREGPEAFLPKGYDVSPPTDDRPFFFQTLLVTASAGATDKADLALSEGGLLYLRRLLLQTTVVAFGLFFLPLVKGTTFARFPVQGTAYFAAIGLGFMLVELPLIHRFTLLLGHPSVAMVVALGALLLGASGGSWWAGRSTPAASRRVMMLLPVLVLVLSLGLGGVVLALLGSWLPVRIAAATVVSVLFGALMGVAFPAGMRAFGASHRSWFWAVNGVASVLASVSSLLLAIAFGFGAVHQLAAVCYLLAAVLLFRARTVSAAA
jgi:hypothetical protein